MILLLLLLPSSLTRNVAIRRNKMLSYPENCLRTQKQKGNFTVFHPLSKVLLIQSHFEARDKKRLRTKPNHTLHAFFIKTWRT